MSQPSVAQRHTIKKLTNTNKTVVPKKASRIHLDLCTGRARTGLPAKIHTVGFIGTHVFFVDEDPLTIEDKLIDGNECVVREVDGK